MPDPIVESVQQFAGSWRTMVAAVPGAFIADDDGISIATINVPMFILNALFLTKPLDSAELLSRLQTARRWMAGCEHPWMLVACDDWLPSGAADVLASHDLQPSLTFAGMVADALEPPVRPAPPELEFRTTFNSELMEVMMDVNADAYGMPVPMGRASIKPGLLSKDSYCVAGYVDGRPVSVTATFAVNQCLYVGWVGTLPDAQRKGYAEAVMRRSLADAAAATGLTRTVLHATAAGRPIYLRMGYRDTVKFTAFAHGLDH